MTIVIGSNLHSRTLVPEQQDRLKRFLKRKSNNTYQFRWIEFQSYSDEVKGAEPDMIVSIKQHNCFVTFIKEMDYLIIYFADESCNIQQLEIDYDQILGYEYDDDNYMDGKTRSRKKKTSASPNRWINFVKNLQKKKKISYSEALKVAKPLYRKSRKP
jgi:hypothetical protein